LSFFAFCLGGCGAPLRDKGGAPIANLRKFSKENEPSPRNNADLRRSGRHGSNQQIDNGNDSDGSTDGRYDSKRRSSAREFGGDHENSRDCDVDYDRNRRRIKSTFSSESPRHNSTSRSYSDSGAGSPTGSCASPKKFMGAIKQMNSGMGDKERETKYRSARFLFSALFRAVLWITKMLPFLPIKEKEDYMHLYYMHLILQFFASIHQQKRTGISEAAARSNRGEEAKKG
jgi:hypothetical protein